MNDKSPEELMIRWMDGESLAPADHATLKQMHEDDPEKLINPGELKRIKSALQSTYTSEMDVPNADAFQAAIMQKLAQEQPAPRVSETTPDNVTAFPSEKPRSKNWLLNAAAMAACFLLGLLINLAFLNKGDVNTLPITQFSDQADKLQPIVYTAYENLSVDYLSDNETNVIVVEGLDAIPDDIDLFALAEAHQQHPIRVQPQISYPEHDH